MKPGTLVELEWFDSERVMLGWAELREYRKALKDRSIYRTAGYLVGQTRHAVMVSHSKSDNGMYADAMVIPRTSIKSRRKL